MPRAPRIERRVVDNVLVTVIGAERAVFGDLHHRFLRASWTVALTSIVVFFLALNAVFALVYRAVGGVTGVGHGGFLDYFSFSVHTMATIGYGSMYPVSPLSQVLVVGEAVLGLLVTAVVTGLVFSKFSQTAGKVVFSRRVTISDMDGVPTLVFRLGNQRSNQIVEATIRVTLVRTERTREGQTFYRMYDLPLVRERSPAVSRSWTVMHRIEEGGLLHGRSADDLAREEVELLVSLVGTDDTSLTPVHARHRYLDADIAFDHRHVDVLREDEGALTLDLRKFHEIEPVPALSPGAPSRSGSAPS